jgi:Tfp pilus assembly protein PilO
MKFSKLPKEKKNHLIMVGVVTLAVLAGLYFGLISSQNGNLDKIADKKSQTEADLEKVVESLKHAGKLEADLAETMKKLKALEVGMASGDLYSWIINTLSTFRKDHPKVEIPQFGPSATPEDMNLFPKFPYKQATLAVAGKAHYHDLGAFIADFENKYPHIRIVNLDLKHNPEGTGMDREKLAFTMDVVALVKPTP